MRLRTELSSHPPQNVASRRRRICRGSGEICSLPLLLPVSYPLHPTPHVIPTEAADSFIVRCVVEGPRISLLQLSVLLPAAKNNHFPPKSCSNPSTFQKIMERSWLRVISKRVQLKQQERKPWLPGNPVAVIRILRRVSRFERARLQPRRLDHKEFGGFSP